MQILFKCCIHFVQLNNVDVDVDNRTKKLFSYVFIQIIKNDQHSILNCCHDLN